MEHLKSIFKHITEAQWQQLHTLQGIYADWNTKINVVSRKDMDNLMERHVLHSLAISLYNQFAPGSKVLDIGTGGGFPGIPLAIIYPETEFLLVDSIGKKITVVNAVIEALGLTNAKGVQGRVEAQKGPFDYAISRAVAPTKELIGWSKKMIRKGQKGTLPNGWLLLKGGDLTQELKQIDEQYMLFDLRNHLKSDFFETKQMVWVGR